MSHDPVAVVRAVLTAWSTNDIESTLAHFAEDGIWIVHVDQAVLPLAGKVQGIAAIEKRLEDLVACFEYLLFRPMEVVAQGEQVRARVEIMVQHRASGEVFSGRLRLQIDVREGKLAVIEEFHDAPLLEAFMRFVNSL
jgi:ketosteroid isomerase-like protein